MDGRFLRIAGLGTFAAALALSGGVAQSQDRHQCLEYSHVETIHQLSENQIILEVEGGTALYLVTTQPRCMRGDELEDIRIEASGNGTCMRMTDTVQYGRRSCAIQDVELIESNARLQEVLAEGAD